MRDGEPTVNGGRKVLVVQPNPVGRQLSFWTAALGILLPMALTAVAQSASGRLASSPATVTQTGSPTQEREKIDGIVAAALVGALSEQLGGRAVKISLDRADIQTVSLRDRLVSGQGKLRIDNGDEWIGFRFSALYDSLQGSAGYPELHIGGSGNNERAVPNDSKLVRQLDDRVITMLRDEFGYQQVRLQLDRIETIEAGTRYLRIDAGGIADFGRDGTAPARVEALYDRSQQQWLRVAYALEPETTGNGSSLIGGR